MQINITNGDYFNEYIKGQLKGTFIPFREAMIEGETSKNIFQDDFNQIRAKAHNTSIEEYKNYMKDLYEALDKIEQIDEITLWFGRDLFCQLNLLTLLAYFDMVNYQGKIEIIQIDDNTKQVINKKELIKKDDYYKKYQMLLCNHQMVDFIDNSLSNAANEFLDLLSENGCIATLIIENKDKLTRRELVELIWDKTRKYGLGDTQVFALIEKYTDYRF